MDTMRMVDRSWPVLRRMMGLHTVAYRATGGVVGHKVPGGPPMLLLDHVGAKSGTKRTSPLVYTQDGDDVVLVASKGGNPKNPAWYHNLRANPETTVQIGREKRPVRAHVATDRSASGCGPRSSRPTRATRVTRSARSARSRLLS
jgi:deazaflavin-dependent oxidoreductase (nitroreductase family)